MAQSAQTISQSAAESKLKLRFNDGSAGNEATIWRSVSPQGNVLYEAMFYDFGGGSKAAEMRVWSGCNRDAASYTVGLDTSFSGNSYFFEKNGVKSQGPARTSSSWHTFRIMTKEGVTWGEIDGGVGPGMSLAQTCSVALRALGSFTGTYEWDSASAFPSMATAPPVQDGKRVAVAGMSGGAPRFAWTEDIYAASPGPTWTANTNGLPASVTEF